MSRGLATRPKYVLYLAVLPFYRQHCMAELSARLGDELGVFAGPVHIDSTVRTGIDSSLYTPVKNVRPGGRALLQLGHWRAALSAETTIVDLNPRSLTAWMILFARRVTRRRTLAWGHLDPRAGRESKTRGVRRFMRSLAKGTVLYGYDSVVPARAALPASPVWVAPNSMYPRSVMQAARFEGDRPRFLYVGRLVAPKKVDLLIRAAAEPVAQEAGVELDIVGQGEQRAELQDLAASLGVSDRVRFHGQITEHAELFTLYRHAVASTSPGYAGLSLTQSIGFGVPIVVADDEPHAPEIELAAIGGIRYFAANSPADLAEKLVLEIRGRHAQDRESLAESARAAYSAEAMADGLQRALLNQPQDLRPDGWPT